MSASVTFAGYADAPVLIDTTNDRSIDDIVAEAAAQLNIEQDVVGRMHPVVNGTSAKSGDIVPENAVVTVSPRVNNG